MVHQAQGLLPGASHADIRQQLLAHCGQNSPCMPGSIPFNRHIGPAQVLHGPSLQIICHKANCVGQACTHTSTPQPRSPCATLQAHASILETVGLAQKAC